MIDRRIGRLQSGILILSFLCLIGYGLSVWLGMKVWFGNQVGGQQRLQTARLTIAEEGEDESPGTGRWWLTDEEGPMLVLLVTRTPTAGRCGRTSHRYRSPSGAASSRRGIESVCWTSPRTATVVASRLGTMRAR